MKTERGTPGWHCVLGATAPQAIHEMSQLCKKQKTWGLAGAIVGKVLASHVAD